MCHFVNKFKQMKCSFPHNQWLLITIAFTNFSKFNNSYFKTSIDFFLNSRLKNEFFGDWKFGGFVKIEKLTKVFGEVSWKRWA